MIEVCPVAMIEASQETVWNLLTDPARLAEWADAELADSEATPTLAPGTVLRLRSRALGRWWPVVWEIHEIEPMRRFVLDVRLPFGIVNHETVTLIPVEEAVRVSFG